MNAAKPSHVVECVIWNTTNGTVIVCIQLPVFETNAALQNTAKSRCFRTRNDVPFRRSGVRHGRRGSRCAVEALEHATDVTRPGGQRRPRAVGHHRVPLVAHLLGGERAIEDAVVHRHDHSPHVPRTHGEALPRRRAVGMDRATRPARPPDRATSTRAAAATPGSARTHRGGSWPTARSRSPRCRAARPRARARA